MRRRTALLAMAGALTVAGCGGDDEKAAVDTRPTGAASVLTSRGTTDTGYNPQILRDSEITALPRTSPAYAVLSWWQAVQFKDEFVAREWTSRTAIERRGSAQFTRDFEDVDGSVPGLRIGRTIPIRDRVSVRVARLFYDAKTGKLTQAVPLTIPVQRTAQGWRVADLRYLTDTAAAARAARP